MTVERLAGSIPIPLTTDLQGKRLQRLERWRLKKRAIRGCETTLVPRANQTRPTQGTFFKRGPGMGAIRTQGVPLVISPGSRSLVRAAETVNTSRFVKRLADGRPQTAINLHPEVTEFSANAGCTIAATEDSLLTKPHRNQCAEDGVLEGCFDGSTLAFGGFAFFICSPRSWT